MAERRTGTFSTGGAACVWVRGRQTRLMYTVFSRTERVGRPALDLYCELEPHYAEKFVYLEKDDRIKVIGLGSVHAADSFEAVPVRLQGRVRRSPVVFAAGAFDPDDTRPANSLFRALEGAAYVLPWVALIEEGGKTYVQLNGLEPVREDPSEIVSAASGPCGLIGADIPYALVPDSRERWFANVEGVLRRIEAGEVDKVVLARELRVETAEAFTSRTMLANLLAADLHGTIILHEVNGVFFIGATPELLVRKQGRQVTTMSLAGTTAIGETEEARVAGAVFLLNDPKNLREHAYVADHIRERLAGCCTRVRMPDVPSVLTLRHLQHLWTPVTAKAVRGVSLIDLRDRLHPTPALAGSPVDAAKAIIRETEPFNRGLYGGTFGFVDFEGDGEFSVAIRTGVFARDHGYVYAGCGIVEGSDPASEYDEIAVKLKTILSAFRGPRDEGRTDG
jgi:menaquinone-specific isochorismate synthase